MFSLGKRVSLFSLGERVSLMSQKMNRKTSVTREELTLTLLLVVTAVVLVVWL
jgi:hypothetical protein